MAFLTEEAARVAADWWTNKISKFKHHDNGANDQANCLAMAMADTLYKQPSEEQIENFRDKLTKKLIGSNDLNDYNNIWLSCDYGPCRLLNETALEVGINPMNFPFKTDMDIRENVINVSDGYGMPWETIWKKENSNDVSRTEHAV